MEAIAKDAAERVAKNAGIAPQLAFAPILFALQDAAPQALARRDGGAGEVAGCAEPQVGRAVYERIENLVELNPNPDTSECVELDYLSHLAESVEEIGGYDGPIKPLHPAPASAPGEWDIRETVHAWIREDVGLNVKMTLFPDVVTKLVDRLAALRQPDTAAEDACMGRGEDDLWPVGSWLSAALDDPKVCDEMKADIRAWFDGGGHLRTTPADPRPDARDEALREAREYLGGQDPITSSGGIKNSDLRAKIDAVIGGAG